MGKWIRVVTFPRGHSVGLDSCSFVEIKVQLSVYPYPLSFTQIPYTKHKDLSQIAFHF